ncbi:23S rRNA (uracil(747)-C(5))-methyltransferase RlmC [Ruania halotolerans]|uniref:23S rRNA (uracil(747)-C(5))-methyltransferase RlmC n=1 Tax=Ruania halotolerans TaxID=2897773 RepID=UPI001E4FFAAE|nr:23S rRNA (uracil(747)-C(5))-methyltransferase RlmC [Ruania halotolerans]UFU06652.1 23S rRNA (uracil(747)-C(5))-methyltransferase RlmC [Ruania halotolerans]
MRCDYYESDRCRSCTVIQTPYEVQLSAKDVRARAALGESGIAWEPPVASGESGFRNKAKMVAGGSVDAPKLGILTSGKEVQDLRECPLHEPAVAAALPVLAEFVTAARLVPYDVTTRRGELKYVLVTGSPEGELLVRFVLRSTESVPRIRKHLGWLTQTLPNLVVASVNLHPTHSALVEGQEELLLTEQELLPMRVGAVELALRPQGFFQTNTPMAATLYRLAAEWTAHLEYRTAWDLYSGVGGFAMHLARDGAMVTGIESSGEAVAAATASAERAGLSGVQFAAGDAGAFARHAQDVPDLVVVNPPRRGIGAELAACLESSGVGHVLYSSCHVDSLAQDVAAMPSLTPVRARVLDMFPHTGHFETLVLLER